MAEVTVHLAVQITSKAGQGDVTITFSERNDAHPQGSPAFPLEPRSLKTAANFIGVHIMGDFNDAATFKAKAKDLSQVLKNAHFPPNLTIGAEPDIEGHVYKNERWFPAGQDEFGVGFLIRMTADGAPAMAQFHVKDSSDADKTLIAHFYLHIQHSAS